MTMSRSSKATPTHVYQPHPDLVDTCVCGRHDPRRVNAVHQLPDLSEATRESRRRTGDDDS